MLHIIIVGCGFVGAQLGELLSVEGHDVVMIDKNPDAFKRLGSIFNGIRLNGYGFDEEVLKEAGITGCNAFAAVTDQDNTNIMAAEIATRIYEVPKVVIRLYDAKKESTLKQLGINYISATTMMAQGILEKLIENHGCHLLVRKDIEMIEFIASHAVHNKRVKDIELANDFRICHVTRDGTGFIPWRESMLYDGDVLIAFVKNDVRSKIDKYFRKG